MNSEIDIPRASLSLTRARRLALRAQALDGDRPALFGAEGVARTIGRLGYVQIDSISVVERAHHHILWARQPDYAPDALTALFERDRRVFEWWSWRGTAAYLPVHDYAFHAWRMHQGATGWRRAWLTAHADVVEHVLERIREEGPLGSADFAAPPDFQGRGWWDWKPAKRALEALFYAGRVLVAGRRGFQRLYDLPERVLPSLTTAPRPSDEEAVRWLIRRILASEGVSRSVYGWGWKADREPLCSALGDMVASGEVVALDIEGTRAAYYALASTLDRAGDHVPADGALVLSPFDPLIIDRQRSRELFGRDYRLECYLPAAKRRFGYFMLPLLWGEEIVGRMDAKAHRQDGRLEVRRLEIEADVDAGAATGPLSTAIRAYATMNGCAEVSLPAHDEAAVTPAAARDLLAAALAG